MPFFSLLLYSCLCSITFLLITIEINMATTPKTRYIAAYNINAVSPMSKKIHLGMQF